MPDLSQSANLSSPSSGTTSSYALVDYERAKFSNSGGTVAVRNDQFQLIAGEDLTNNVLVSEQRYSYAYSAAVGTTVVKASAGFLHGIHLGSTSAGGNITIYDNASGTSATVIGLIKASAVEGFYQFNCTFANGCVVANVGTQVYTALYR